MKKNLSKILVAWIFTGLLASCSENISILPEAESLKTKSTVSTVSGSFQSVTSIDDIQNWTGTGDYRSVLAIQWVTAVDIEDPTNDEIHFLAWGYRWNSADFVTGIDMVKDIAKKDSHLYVILGSNFGGTTIKGFAYDGNNDGKIEIKNSSLTLTQDNFKDGIYWEKSGDSFDNMTSSNVADLWMGGWMKAYASYWLSGNSTSVPDSFEYSPYLVDLRELENNSWDAWTFSTINSSEFNVEPRTDLLKAVPNN